MSKLTSVTPSEAPMAAPFEAVALGLFVRPHSLPRHGTRTGRARSSTVRSPFNHACGVRHELGPALLPRPDVGPAADSWPRSPWLPSPSSHPWLPIAGPATLRSAADAAGPRPLGDRSGCLPARPESASAGPKSAVGVRLFRLRVPSAWGWWLGGGGLRLDSGLGAGNLWGVWCSLGEGDSVWCSTWGGVVLGWCWLSCRPGG